MGRFKIREVFLKKNLTILNSQEIGYVHSLEEQHQILRFGNVIVDIPQLILRPFKCLPSTCVKKIRQNGKVVYRGSCCTDLSIEVTLDEIMKIKKLFSLALISKRKIPLMIIKRVQLLDEEGFFGQNNVYEYYLLSKRNNTCILSEMNTRREIYCLIDHICSFLDLPRLHYKPLICFMWPLHYTEIGINCYFLTLVTNDNCGFLGRANFSPKCLKDPPSNVPSAYVSLQQQIIYIFGQEFYNCLSNKASEVLMRRKYRLRKEISY